MDARLKLKAVVYFAVMVLLLLAVSTAAHHSQADVVTFPLEGAFVPNEILVGVRPELAQNLTSQTSSSKQFGITSLDQLGSKYAVQQISPIFTRLDTNDLIAIKYGLAGMYKLTVPIGTDIFAMMAEYQADPAIIYAEPNRIYVAMDTPNDTDFGEQWALHNSGQTDGQVDADIDAPEAWDIEKGKTSVLIAIIDTGVDYTHSDLSGGRVRTDIDRDFINDDDDAMDDHGHGTFVAGIAAADSNNENGIAGVCQGCSILPVKVLNSEGSGSAESVAQGIQYAADKEADVISMSLGFPSNCGCSQTVANAINYAFERGSLLVAASGNDSDKERLSYPASSSRVLSVGATNHNDQESDFSNRGPYLDIVAPGEDIYSLDLGNTYRTASGTSAAAPHVSGVAGLLLSANPDLSNVELWWRMYQSADDLPTTTSASSGNAADALVEVSATLDLTYHIYLPGVTNLRSTFGRLNAHRALTNAISGQMYAPVDTCSSEASCPPGCGAEVALVGAATVVTDLQLLRDFRDKVLALSRDGQQWIELYERNRVEVATILATNKHLREQARSALNQWLPLIEVLVYPNSANQAILTRGHLEAAEAVLDGLSSKGSSQLNGDLEAARELLERSMQFVGKDVREAWDSLQE